MIAIKDGWSWPAFFFNWIWALTKSLWIPAVISLVIIIPLIMAGGFPSLAVGIVFGIYGNKWWANNVMKQGYSELTMVQAPNPASAIMLAQQMRNAGAITPAGAPVINVTIAAPTAMAASPAPTPMPSTPTVRACPSCGAQVRSDAPCSYCGHSH